MKFNMQMQIIDTIELHITVYPGISFNEAAKECLSIATKEWRNVNLHFNDKIFKIEVDKLFSTITELNRGLINKE